MGERFQQSANYETPRGEHKAMNTSRFDGFLHVQDKCVNEFISPYTHIHVYIYKYTYICVFAFLSFCKHACARPLCVFASLSLHICAYTCVVLVMHTHMCQATVCMRICISTHITVRIHIYIFMYTYRYVHACVPPCTKSETG